MKRRVIIAKNVRRYSGYELDEDMPAGYREVIERQIEGEPVDEKLLSEVIEYIEGHFTDMGEDYDAADDPAYNVIRDERR